MPAMLDDPTAPAIYRTSGDPPFPVPGALPPGDFSPRQVTLRDRSTTATLFAFSSPEQVPRGLLAYLCQLLNQEIETGDTYPMINQLPLDRFGPYWFANFGAVMLLGELESMEQVWEMENNRTDWNKYCLGSFYVKPNYPGRSSHICNGGFLVGGASRGRGAGRLMGECYLEWAPKLGYTYSIFNLVYETNVASLRIWDALGFKRVGKVKGAGNLKSYPDRLVDAIVFGRDLNGDLEDYLSEERFDKIRYYLKNNIYPIGADRAEKSRLRSASAHYRFIPATDTEKEKLMLKGKEVVSDPVRQYQIAKQIHYENHGGINKTTSTIAETYHWVRIKETASIVIKACPDCKVVNKPAGGKITERSQVEDGSRGRMVKQQDESSSSPTPNPDHGFPHPITADSESTHQSRHEQQIQQAPVAQMNPYIQADTQEQTPISVADMSDYNYDMTMVDPSLDAPQMMQGAHEGSAMEQYQASHEQYPQDQSQHQMQQYGEQFHNMEHGMPQSYHDPSMGSAYMAHGSQDAQSGAPGAPNGGDTL